MPTSEERREVAAKLRESREYISGLPYVSLEQNAFKTFDRILECVGYESGNIFDYLADLVDPTCHDVGDPYDGCCFECSRCGEMWEMICGSPSDNGLNFCPHCGAMVVSE